jgi:hypothetical protein
MRIFSDFILYHFLNLKIKGKLDMVVHTSNLSTQDFEAGGLFELRYFRPAWAT